MPENRPRHDFSGWSGAGLTLGNEYLRAFMISAARLRPSDDRTKAHVSLAYEDLYLTEQPYGLVVEVVTGLPARDSSSAALT